MRGTFLIIAKFAEVREELSCLSHAYAFKETLIHESIFTVHWNAVTLVNFFPNPVCNMIKLPHSGTCMNALFL